MNKIIIIGIICAGCSGEAFTSDGDAGNFGDAGDSGWAGGSGDSGSSGGSGASGSAGISGTAGVAGVSGSAGTSACRTSCYQAVKEDFGDKFLDKISYCLTDNVFADYDKFNLCDGAICNTCASEEAPDNVICGALLLGFDLERCTADADLGWALTDFSYKTFPFSNGIVMYDTDSYGRAGEGVWGSKDSVVGKPCPHQKGVNLANICYPASWVGVIWDRNY